MSEHTPGPWTLHPGRNHFYTQCSEGMDFAAAAQTCYYIAGPLHDSDFVADLIVNKLQETGDANARLIAAAPDLLAACKIAVADASQAVNPTARLRNYDAMREAIAKAEERDQPTTNSGTS